MKTAPALCALVIAVLGCGSSSSDPPSDSAGGSGSTATPLRVCEVFTADIATEALGGPVINTFSSYSDGCSWRLETAKTGSNGLLVRIYSVEGTLEAFKSENDARTYREAVAGLGQAAYMDTVGSELTVYTGKYVASMSPPADNAVTKEQVIAAMKRVLAKIPA